MSTMPTTASTALAKMREKRYGLVISDWNMEPMTGYDLLQAKCAPIPALGETPFIMVTAESKTENVIAASKAGVNNYIVKPFNAQTLKTKIEAVLAASLAPARPDRLRRRLGLAHHVEPAASPLSGETGRREDRVQAPPDRDCRARPALRHGCPRSRTGIRSRRRTAPFRSVRTEFPIASTRRAVGRRAARILARVARLCRSAR